MRIVSWNVNSLRARLHRVGPWLERHTPDVVLLQETKCTDAAFPASALEAAGYEVAHCGGEGRASGYNGVAIASRVGLTQVRRGFPTTHRDRLLGRVEQDWDAGWTAEPRLLTARCGGVRVSSVYVPNGRAVDHAHYRYKLAWLDTLAEWMGRPGRSTTLVAGDMNVAPADPDVWNPKGWRGRTHVSPAERERIARIAASGWVDAWHAAACAAPDAPAGADAVPVRFTWWNYRPGCFAKDQGLRVDLAFASPKLVRRLGGVWVDRPERGRERPSDHAPLVVDLLDEEARP